jgi:hypothetical protein
MKRLKRRELSPFNLSMLDCISCGFGAIILLYVLVQGSTEQVISEIREDLTSVLRAKENAMYEMRGQVAVDTLDLKSLEEQLSKVEVELARLQGNLATARGEFESSKSHARKQAAERDELQEALLRLDTTRVPTPVKPESVVAGVPADSRYLIFIVDTSGSMRGYQSMVSAKLAEVIQIFPNVTGLQLLDADGLYVQRGSEKMWIKDSPAARQAMVAAYEGYSTNSSSNPAPGIIRAIRDFYDGEKKISLIVLGDEMQSSDVGQFLNIVGRANPRQRDGQRLVRIHAVGFPTDAYDTDSGRGFSDIMRLLTQLHDGAFIGLNRESIERRRR